MAAVNLYNENEFQNHNGENFMKEEEILRRYIRNKNLKQSQQRFDILKVFLGVERHLSTEELYKMVQRVNPDVGYVTVYRTMRLMCECGLARELKLEDGITRYEHMYAHKHHDHLICTSCGRITEVYDDKIEKMQDKLSRKHKFSPSYHKMEIYGLCAECMAKKNKKRKEK